MRLPKRSWPVMIQKRKLLAIHLHLKTMIVTWMVVLVLLIISVNWLKPRLITAQTNSHPSHSRSQDVYLIEAVEKKGLTWTLCKLIGMPNELRNGGELTLTKCLKVENFFVICMNEQSGLSWLLFFISCGLFCILTSMLIWKSIRLLLWHLLLSSWNFL